MSRRLYNHILLPSPNKEGYRSERQLELQALVKTHRLGSYTGKLDPNQATFDENVAKIVRKYPR